MQLVSSLALLGLPAIAVLASPLPQQQNGEVMETYTSWYPTMSSGVTVTVFVTKTEAAGDPPTPTAIAGAPASTSSASTTLPWGAASSPSLEASPPVATTSPGALQPVQGGSVAATSSPPPGASLAASPTPSSQQSSPLGSSSGSDVASASQPTTSAQRSSATVGIVVGAVILGLALLAGIAYAVWRVRKLRPAEQAWRQRTNNIWVGATKNNANIASGGGSAGLPTASSGTGSWSGGGKASPSGLGFVDSIKEKLGRHVSISRRRSFLNYVPPISSMPAPSATTSNTRVLENMAPGLPPAWTARSAGGVRKKRPAELKSEKHVYPEDRAAWMTHCRFLNGGSTSNSKNGSTSTLEVDEDERKGSLSSHRSSGGEERKGKDNPWSSSCALLGGGKDKDEAASKPIVSRPQPLPSGTAARFGGIDSMPPPPRTAPVPPVPRFDPYEFGPQQPHEVSAFDDSPTETRGGFGGWVKKVKGGKKGQDEEHGEGRARQQGGLEMSERSYSVGPDESFMRI